MVASIEQINPVPIWAQWVGIWSSFLALIIALLFEILGKYISYYKPRFGFIFRVCVSTFLVIFGALVIWLASIRISKGESSLLVFMSVFGTLSFVSGLICFLSLSTRLTRRLFLWAMRHCGPIGRCTTHISKLRQSFDSLDLLLQRNAKSAWLLPPPSLDVICDIDHGVDYLELEIREWSWLVTGSKGRNGLIEDTKYLFITWNLERPNEWTGNLIEKLSPMLIKLGEKAQVGELFVHRVMIGPWLRMTVGEWNDFEKEIWKDYIGPYCSEGNENYKVRFLDIDELAREFGSKKDRKALEVLLDVSFFSFDQKMQDIVKAKKTAGPPIVLPFPEDFTNEDYQEYAALQYSEYFDGFLALQAVQGTSANRRGTKYGDKAIKERRIIVRHVLDRTNKLKNINSEIKRLYPSFKFEEF